MILLYLVILAAFSFLSSLSLFPSQSAAGLPGGDAQTFAAIASVIAKGGGMYRDFGIVYGPARFILLSWLFNAFKTGLSYPLMNIYMSFIGLVLAPVLTYLAVYSITQEVKAPKAGSVIFGLIASFMYYFWFAAAQDAHVAAMLFILLYTAAKPKKRFLAFLTGVALTLVFMFRVDTGLISLASIILIELAQQQKRSNLASMLSGFLISGLAFLIFIAIDGSLKNYFHDTVLLGLITQPKQMDVRIGGAEFPLFAGFYFMNFTMLLFGISSKNKPLALLTIVNFLLFAAALGRSDMGHLFYSLVLFPATLMTIIPELSDRLQKKGKESFGFLQLFVSAGLIYFSILILKKESFPLLFVMALAVAILTRIRKEVNMIHGFIMAFVSLFIILGSASLFKFYFPPGNIRLDLASSVYALNHINEWKSNLYKGDFGGNILSPADKKALAAMKADIGKGNVLVFPTTAGLYDALGKKPPIRFFSLDVEHTKQMDQEIIRNLSSKHVEYVLYSKRWGDPVKTPVHDYIISQYKTIKSYQFDGGEWVLMKR